MFAVFDEKPSVYVVFGRRTADAAEPLIVGVPQDACPDTAIVGVILNCVPFTVNVVASTHVWEAMTREVPDPADVP